MMHDSISRILSDRLRAARPGWHRCDQRHLHLVTDAHHRFICEHGGGAAPLAFESAVQQLGDVSIDLAERVARRQDGSEVRLTPLEHRMLETLARHADRIVTHTSLLKEVWGPNRDDSRSLRVYIGNLRCKEVDPYRFSVVPVYRFSVDNFTYPQRTGASIVYRKIKYLRRLVYQRTPAYSSACLCALEYPHQFWSLSRRLFRNS